MENILLIIGRVALLLLYFGAVYCQTQNETESLCTYQYLKQPTRANCTPEESLPLELICQVRGSNNNFTIQWHYSSSPPSQDSYVISSMESVIGNDSETVDKIVEEKLDSFVVTSKLNYEMAAGYYWCTVINAGYPTPNPSQVLNISTCPFSGDTTSLKCNGSHIRLSDTPSTNRCANHNVSIDEENVLFGTCDANNDKPSTDIKETAMHGSTSEPLTTTDDSYKTEERTTTDRTLPDLDPDSTMLPSSSSGFPVHFIWIIVGVAFALLIAIIIVMLIVIVYLNHKKNKFKVSNMSRNHTHNPYVEETVFPTGTGQQESRAEAGYEIPTNMIHARNATFGGDHSPDSKTSSSRSALHSPPGEYEEVSTVKATRDSIKATQRHQYEMVESDEQSEYSHLQHAHGGSRKFSTNSTGAAPSPSISHSWGKVSITSSLSGHQPEPTFDSPEYMTIGLDGSKSTNTRPETGEGVINADTGYSLINHEALKGVDTTREAEGPDLDSEGYHQLPSVFTGAAKQQPNGEISTEQRQNSHTIHTHPPVHRHKSATIASEPYTPIESTNVMKRNAYSFSIVSTDEQYVSERGHVYHLLERSEEHQQNRLTPGSNEGSPKFHIQEDDSTKDRKESNTIPPYSQVNRSRINDSNKQKETENNEDHSDSNSLQDLSMESSRKVIPPYSQVDKSKKKNRQPQFDHQETHHYHILEQNNEDKIETSSGEKGGPIYHIIDHKP